MSPTPDQLPDHLRGEWLKLSANARQLWIEIAGASGTIVAGDFLGDRRKWAAYIELHDRGFAA